mgnify:CR=1 FL=1
MERRDILIANNRDQSKYRVVTGAETLGQLQDDLRRNEEVYKMVGQTWIKNESPIGYSGLDFTEGITKTKLLERDTQLPANVQFKGQTTNNLVMLLTNTTKNIPSGAGMDRKVAYALVKELGIAGAIQEGEGQNYTRVKNKVLESYINIARNGADSGKEAINEVREELKDQGKVKEVVNTPAQEEAEPEKKLPDVKSAPHAQTVEWFYTGIKSMVKENLLANGDITVLADLLTELALRLEEEKPKITASDMDDMLKSLRRH